ncbi:MAG: DAK2 domain-containing protein, partial [Nocardioidaceae bacterium]|nr:DAK2 domain-containing protein [Nocardioidaceae bacterium]
MPEPATAVATLDLPTVLRFSELALEALGAAREEIDALNVYPVPDSDTGTNLYLTFEAAHEALLDAVGDDPATADLRAALHAFARGALLGARGNSGVIFSQLAGALVKRLAEAGPEDRSAAVFADGLRLASEASYAAVGEPVEGTILSVARSAAESAGAAAADERLRLGHVIRAAASGAREAL